MGGEGVKVGHHKITVKIILHSYIIPDGSEIIAEMQKTGGADATHYYFFLSTHKGGEDKKIVNGIVNGESSIVNSE